MNVHSSEYADPPPSESRSSALCLRLFGPFRVLIHGRTLPKTRTRKEPWLLALLALHADAPVERSWLAGILWPDALGEAALYNLRRSLRGLREALGPEADRLLSPTPRTLRLDLTGADCDLADFDAAARRVDETSLRQAAMLYRGPLLLGCREEWAFPEREARERAMLEALERLATSAGERGGWSEAAAWLGQALEIDPLRETALRGLMEALAAQGRHAAAGEAYRAFRLRLRAELNADPDPETLALYRRLQADGRRGAPPVRLETPLDAPPGESAHLPMPLTPLIGRERETDAVAAALDGARLVTLTGTGGVGKTRLALAVARRLHDEFPDAAWFADLSPLADPDLIPQVVLAALGGQETAGRNAPEALAEFLKPKRLLLVLDNCEQLVTACAGLTRALLERCPGLRILATSREPLRVAGEVQWRVPSLSLPPGGDVAPSDAVRLFEERARGARPGWTPSAPEAAAAADICRRLDGIPLAIEMAAARMRAMTAPQIAARLDDRFRLLVGTEADALPRRQTLRAALDWSWDLLPDDERTLLARMSVFAGGGTLEAAERVCGGRGVDEADVLDGLTGLIDRSLVVYEVRADGEGRYRLLETVRQYARDRLAEAAGAEAAGTRHAAWFLALAEQAEPHLTGTEQTGWLARLETEHDNLRAALARCLGRPEGAADGLRLAGALENFWVIRGHVAEGRQWLDRALAGAGETEAPGTRAKALNGLGNLAFRQGDLEDARRSHEASLALRRRLDMRPGIASSLNNLGNVAWAQGEYERAEALYRENLTIRRGLGHLPDSASALDNLANVAYARGDYAAARSLHEQSLAIRRGLGDRQGTANSLNNLGNVAQAQGDFEAARTLAGESLAIRRELGDRQGIAASLNNLGSVAQAQDDHGTAQALHTESLAIKRELGDKQGVAYSLHNLGVMAAREGNHRAAQRLHAESLALLGQIGDRYGLAHSLEALADAAGHLARPRRAARLFGAATSLRSALGCPVEPASRDDHDRAVASARAASDEPAFAAAWAEGQAMGWEQAVEYALGEAEDLGQASSLGGDTASR